MKKIHRVGGEKMTSFSSSLLLPLLLLLSCCRANASEQQQQQKTVISQQKLENGVLFKVVVSASVPVDSSDVLFNRGVLATTKAQKIRVWCLDMQPRAGKKKNKKTKPRRRKITRAWNFRTCFSGTTKRRTRKIGTRRKSRSGISWRRKTCDRWRAICRDTDDRKGRRSSRRARTWRGVRSPRATV